MRFFIDTANIESIKEIYSLGVLSGVTTNPSIVAKEGKEFIQAIKDICAATDDDAIVFAEVISLEADKMIEEAIELSKLSPKLVIKIPMCAEGLKAVKVLSTKGVRTNVTLVFSSPQALLAARAGANYVSTFVGRHDDVGLNGINCVAEIVEMFQVNGIETEIIAASVRNSIHVVELAKLGVDYATVPPNVFMPMTKHPLTTGGLDGFMKDWATLQASLKK